MADDVTIQMRTALDTAGAMAGAEETKRILEQMTQDVEAMSINIPMNFDADAYRAQVDKAMADYEANPPKIPVSISAEDIKAAYAEAMAQAQLQVEPLEVQVVFVAGAVPGGGTAQQAQGVGSMPLPDEQSAQVAPVSAEPPSDAGPYGWQNRLSGGTVKRTDAMGDATDDEPEADYSDNDAIGGGNSLFRYMFAGEFAARGVESAGKAWNGAFDLREDSGKTEKQMISDARRSYDEFTSNPVAKYARELAGGELEDFGIISHHTDLGYDPDVTKDAIDSAQSSVAFDEARTHEVHSVVRNNRKLKLQEKAEDREIALKGTTGLDQRQLEAQQALDISNEEADKMAGDNWTEYTVDHSASGHSTVQTRAAALRARGKKLFDEVQKQISKDFDEETSSLENQSEVLDDTARGDTDAASRTSLAGKLAREEFQIRKALGNAAGDAFHNTIAVKETNLNNDELGADRASRNESSDDAIFNMQAQAIESTQRANRQGYAADTIAFETSLDNNVVALEEKLKRAESTHEDPQDIQNLKDQITQQRTTNNTLRTDRARERANEDNETDDDLNADAASTRLAGAGDLFDADRVRFAQQRKDQRMTLVSSGASPRTLADFDADTKARDVASEATVNRRYDRMREGAAETILRSAHRDGEADVLQIRQNVHDEELAIGANQPGDTPEQKQNRLMRLADVKARATADLAAIETDQVKETTMGLSATGYWREEQQRAIEGRHYGDAMKSIRDFRSELDSSDGGHPVSNGVNSAIDGLHGAAKAIQDAAEYLKNHTKDLYVVK